MNIVSYIIYKDDDPNKIKKIKAKILPNQKLQDLETNIIYDGVFHWFEKKG